MATVDYKKHWCLLMSWKDGPDELMYFLHSRYKKKSLAANAMKRYRYAQPSAKLMIVPRKALQATLMLLNGK